MHCGAKSGRFETSYHPLSHELVSEWVSQRGNEWAQQVGRSKRREEWCKWTRKGTSEWPSTYVPILGCSEPLCRDYVQASIAEKLDANAVPEKQRWTRLLITRRGRGHVRACHGLEKDADAAVFPASTRLSSFISQPIFPGPLHLLLVNKHKGNRYH